MPDGSKRKRRQPRPGNEARAKWYARYRSERFNRRFGLKG